MGGKAKPENAAPFVILSKREILLTAQNGGKVIIIIIYSGYPLLRSVFQWGPGKIMYNTVTIRYDTIEWRNSQSF